MQFKNINYWSHSATLYPLPSPLPLIKWLVWQACIITLWRKQRGDHLLHWLPIKWQRQLRPNEIHLSCPSFHYDSFALFTISIALNKESCLRFTISWHSPSVYVVVGEETSTKRSNISSAKCSYIKHFAPTLNWWKHREIVDRETKYPRTSCEKKPNNGPSFRELGQIYSTAWSNNVETDQWPGI